ncbi:hypothetical protein FSP39_022457, partial [Pinctada imbricata]
QKAIRDTPFSSNYIGVQQALEQTKDTTTQIKALKRKAEEIKKTKGETSEGQTIDAEYELLEDLALQKKRCLETILYVSEVENLLQNVQTEFEDRALYLTERRKVFESIYREDSVAESARMHRDCVYALRGSWNWLSQVTRCMEIHMQNAGEYHQFFHDVQFLDEDMEIYLASQSSRKCHEIREPEVMMAYLREVTNKLLDYQSRIDRLSEISGQIHPIQLRREESLYPIKARVLVLYRHQEIKLNPGDEVSVLDNSEPDRWQIRDKDGNEAEVPVLYLLYRPLIKPQLTIYKGIYSKTKDQLVVHWDTSLRRLRSQLMYFLTNSMKGTSSSELSRISSAQKADLMKLLNEAVQLLRPISAEDPEFKVMMLQVTNFRKVLSQIKTGDKNYTNGTTQVWQANGKVLTTYKEFLTYAKAYKENLAATREQEKLLLKGTGTRTYSSKAYFERVLPLTDLDVETGKTEISRISAEMVIHERAKGKRPVPPPRRRRGLKRVISVAGNNDLMEFPESSEESKPFTITGVVDPRTRQKLSVFQAMAQGILDQANGTYTDPTTGKSMSIPEAIRKGLVTVDTRENLTNGDTVDGFSPMRNTLESQTFPVAGVIDPRTGEWIGVKEALTAGILDQRTNKYKNIVTGEELDFLEAVKNGYLIVDPNSLDEMEEEGCFTFVDFADSGFRANSVVDPTTGEEISYQRAIKDGVIDPRNGVYRNPHTGETISLESAIRQGLIKGQFLQPGEDDQGEDVFFIKQLQVKKQKFIPGEGKGMDGAGAMKQDPNSAMYDKVRNHLDPAKSSVLDPNDITTISLEEAFDRGIIDFATCEFKIPDGETLTLEQAATRNFIEPELLRDILQAYKDSSLGELVDSGKLDPETSLITDPATGHTMSLESAIAQKLVDPDLLYIYDVPSQKLVTLASAMKNGQYDPSTGKFRNPKTGEMLSLAEAEKSGIVRTHIDPEKMAQTAKTLERLQKLMDTKIPASKSESSGNAMTVEEAIKSGALDLQNGLFTDPDSGEIIPISEAIRLERIDPTAARSLLEAMDKLSMQDLMQKGLINPKTGLFCPEDKSKPISIDEAIKQGLINPENVFLVDKGNDNIVSLDSLIKSGLFDPKTGQYIDPNTGEKMSLEEAVKRGLIDLNIDPELFIDSSRTLKDLIDSSKVSPRSTYFVAPNNHKLSLRDALANGFLTMNSKVKLDGEGNVVLASDEEVVQCLVDIKENSDWMTGVEQTLGSRTKPSQRLEKLKDHALEVKAVQEDMTKRKPGVTDSIRQSEELIENNKSQKKEDAAQQLKKLRSNVADLKVRFDAAFGEAGNRSKRLVKMSADLEEFYKSLQDLDQWLDQAIEKYKDLQTSKDGIETQYEEFKDFVEELQSKEVEMANASKMADEFRDNAQEFEKEAEAYRQRIQVLPSIKEESDNDVIDDELESLEEKYRDISRDCTKHMDKLAAAMKQKKTFDDLKEKLGSVYPQIEKKLKSVDSKNFGKNSEKDSKDLGAVKDAKADLIGQERKLRELTQASEKLVKGLSDLGMRNKADEVKNAVSDLKDKHSALQGEINEKEHELEAAVSQQQNVMNRLDGIIQWMNDAESALNEGKGISLDKERLAVQLKEQQLMNAEIERNKALLDRLSKELSNVPNNEEAEESIFDLNERIVDVERKAEDRLNEIEEISASVADLETNYDMERLRCEAKSLIEADNVSDTFALKECVGEVEVKWHELTEHLVQQVSLEALTEISGMLKYLDKAENEINTAEPVNIEPETLTVQLKDHQSFNEDLNQKRNAVKDIINKCNRMLRETTNSQTDEIKSQFDSIRTQADIVCQLSAERLHHLEAALPLATHFSENQSEISTWLEEMEAELKAQMSPGENLEQVKKQLDNVKAAQQKIEDHKPFLEDLNTTGLELMELCCDDDAGEIQNKLLSYNGRYDKLKTQVREKAKELIEARGRLTQEVSDSMDHILEDLAQLNRTVTTADPVAANPDKLQDQLRENKLIMEDLDNHRSVIASTDEAAKKLLNQGVEDSTEAEDLKQKITELATLNNQIRDATQRREGELTGALKVSQRFFDLCNDTMSNLRDLKDNLLSQEPPGVDSSTVREQQKELKELRKELGKARLSLEECRQTGEQLSGLCGDPGLMEIRKQLEDIHNVADDVHDIARDREEDLKKALGHAEKFQELHDNAMSWLPMAEHQLERMEAVATTPEGVKQQMEELKSTKAQVHPHVADVEQLNQELSALKDMSPIAAESLQKPVEEINSRWSHLLKEMADREVKLNQAQLKLGELESGMDDAVSNLQHIHQELENYDDVKGDPKCLETHMKKLQLLHNDLRAQDKACKKLNAAVADILSQNSSESPELKQKQEVMNEQLREVQANLRDKEAKLQENLRQVKKYLGEVDDQLQWVNDLRQELKSAAPCGALPETANSQVEAYMARYEELQAREDALQSLLARGQELSEECPPEDIALITEKLHKLKERWNDTSERADKHKDKLSEHMNNVNEFHGTLKAFTDWLNNAEITMRGFKYPSKLVDRVTVQMAEHEKLKAELEQQIEKMQSLDRTGSYLKHFGRKQDTIYIKNLLVGIRLRWKKLLRRTDERGRLLRAAYREDKRFYDSWKSLIDWLDDSSKSMNRFMAPVSQGGATKQNIDDLKRFQHQLAGKHQAFYSATRLGRNLKDRCTKQDEERDILQHMLDELKNKWNSVRSVISRSQNKLDEALLTSGRVADAISSLLEWLGKAEASLAEDQPIMGDLDTIHMLIEHHKTMQQELGAREQTVAAMKASGDIPPSHLEELETTWDRVNHLADIRENRLRDSLKLAEEFQEVVQVMRDFLPQAEAELKFKSLPDDEMSIIQLIEKHEKFQEDLRNHQDCVDKIRILAEEILQNCHPNAIRFVKYYLTITQTRWDQLLQRAKNRGQRLQDALKNIQGNAALVEELLAWLNDAHILLSTKERDPIPEDLKVVEDLVKEHAEFHDEVTSKNNDVERLTKIITSEPKSPGGRHYGSNMRLNDMDGYNPRVLTLQNKWRTVWRMSVDRKKGLQDALDTLLELESFKTFDFEVWKQKYLNWIKAKKLRITDFFRRQDKDGDGFLSRDEFVNGMLQTHFPTNKTELHAVFDIFDPNNRHYIEYKDFIEAMKPVRHQKTRLKSGKQQMSDAELIHDEIEKEVSQCQCRNPFRADMIEEGKYRFGEKQNIRLVRFLNSTVMVRVGGGWVTLDEFLETNDPCRAKGRTNYDLRDTLSPNGNTTFRSRRGSGTYGYKSKLNDTGYASSNSSAGSSGDNSLRRSRVTSSMVNLSGAGGATSTPRNTMRRNPDFGSTGSLQRTKRLSNSSSAINTPTKPRTPAAPNRTLTPSYGSKTPTFARSKTPQPYVPRSTTPTPPRPSTARTSMTPKTSTPVRTGRATPTFSGGRGPPSGRATPTGRTTPTMQNGLNSSMDRLNNTRRLPSTPKTSR